MERNQVIGFILIFATLMIWTMMSSPSKEELERQKFIQDSIARVEAEVTKLEKEEVKDHNNNTNTSIPNDAEQQLLIKSKYGQFDHLASASDKHDVLENDLIKLTFSNKGGRINQAELKGYYVINESEDHKESRDQLYLLNNDSNRWQFDIKTGIGNNTIKSSELFFSVDKSNNSITYTAENSNGIYLKQKYSLKPNSYHVDYKIWSNSPSQLFNDGKMNFYIENHLNRLEKNDQFEQRYSTIYYKENNENPDYCSCASDANEDFESNTLDWISFSNQFFNTSLIPKNGAFSNAKLETKMTDLDTDNALKILKSNFDLDINNSNEFEMALYIGPNDYGLLKGYGVSLENIIPFGNSIFGTINRHVIRPFFNFLSKFISSKGIVIILLIFIIKMLLYPLLYKMLHSQAKMSALKPEIAKIKEKNKDDAQKTSMETMKLYREYGASPFGGCLPMIVQMPIWYALFRFFPASITFRQEAFLWANDLSSYDVLTYLPFEIPFMGSHLSLFTILWAISTIVYTYYNSQAMDMSANPAMKYMQYFMPVMFLGFFNSYASGLTCYMLFNNVINVTQTIITKKFIFDEDKIRAELEKQKAKPKKKSTFATRLEEAMKQQQKLQQQKKKGK